MDIIIAFMTEEALREFFERRNVKIED